MEIYILHWCNVEEMNVGVEVFTDLEIAVNKLNRLIETDYIKDHVEPLDRIIKSCEIEDDEIIEPCELYPYIYSITKKKIDLYFSPKANKQ